MLKAATLTVLLALCGRAHADCATENAEVTVTGTIGRETFAGPPNYESVANGDRPETYWILTASRPISICVTGAKRPASDGSQRLQLVLDEKRYSRYSPLLDQRVSVRGTIWSAQTGHHHTEALLTVEDMRPVAELAARAAVCPASFADFLVKFEADDGFRHDHIQFPLPVSYVDAAASPEPATRTAQVSRADFVSKPWYPAADVQTRRGLQKRVEEISGQRRLVHVHKPDTDYLIEFQFTKAGSCWRLTKADDRSL